MLKKIIILSSLFSFSTLAVSSPPICEEYFNDINKYFETVQKTDVNRAQLDALKIVMEEQKQEIINDVEANDQVEECTENFESWNELKKNLGYSH